MDQQLLQTVVGYASATLVSLLNLPQAIAVYRARSASALSPLSLALHVANGLLWLSYGAMLDNKPIMIANFFYFWTNIALVSFRWKFGREVGGTN